jgi:hypothetical protein
VSVVSADAVKIRQDHCSITVPNARLGHATEKDLKAGTLSEVLRSHLISEEAEAAMRRDDFEGFLRARETAIATEITRLMSH